MNVRTSIVCSAVGALLAVTGCKNNSGNVPPTTEPGSDVEPAGDDMEDDAEDVAEDAAEAAEDEAEAVEEAADEAEDEID